MRIGEEDRGRMITGWEDKRRIQSAWMIKRRLNMAEHRQDGSGELRTVYKEAKDWKRR